MVAKPLVRCLALRPFVPMDLTLQRNPVYQQLNDRLRSALGSEFQRGDKFLTERQISERFDVSRATANKALSGLVSEGLLEFRRGIGTFVRQDLINYDVRSLVSFTEMARATGKRPSTQLLDFRKTDSDTVAPAITSALDEAPESALWEVRRVRLADRVPVILEHRYIVAEHCPKLTRAQVKSSLYRAFVDDHQLQVDGAEEVIRAVTLKASESKLLDTTNRSPAFEVTAVGFLSDARPLWWERTLYRAERYEFHSRLGPLQTATPPRGKLR